MLNDLITKLSCVIIGNWFGGWKTFTTVLQRTDERQARHAMLQQARLSNKAVKRPVKWIVAGNYTDFKFLRDFVETWAPGVWEVSYLRGGEPAKDSQADQLAGR